MDKTISSYEAKTKLPQLLRDVENGYSFIITRHGIPVGRLVHIDETPKKPEQSLMDSFTRLAKENGRMSQESYKELRDEGRTW